MLPDYGQSPLNLGGLWGGVRGRGRLDQLSAEIHYRSAGCNDKSIHCDDIVIKASIRFRLGCVPGSHNEWQWVLWSPIDLVTAAGAARIGRWWQAWLRLPAWLWSPSVTTGMAMVAKCDIVTVDIITTRELAVVPDRQF